MKKNIDDFFYFIRYDIWRITEGEVNKKKYFLYYIIKTLYLSLTRSDNYRLLRQASALSYSMLLAIVPIVALLFAIAKGFGVDKLMETQIMTALDSNKYAAEFIINFVVSYLEQAKGGIFIGVGLIVLFWTVINLINNVEDVFNRIWDVKNSRSIYRKITDYFSMLIIVPVFIVVSGGLSIYINNFVAKTESFFLLAPISKLLIKSIPFVITWFIITALYIFMPNTKVKFKPAFISGIIMGTTYQLFQNLYINSQIWVSSYNTIYGSFAALPLFLIWLQISWIIVLFGAELTYSIQNMHKYSFEKDIDNISRRYIDFSSLIVSNIITKRFHLGLKPYTAKQIAEESNLPIKLVKRILSLLIDVDIIHEVPLMDSSEELVYQPSIDISKLTVGVILEKIYTKGSEHFKIDTEDEYSKQWNILLNAVNETYEKGNNIQIKDFI